MPSPPSPAEISAAICAVTSEFLQAEPRGILAINDGYCEDLAFAVLERLGREEGDGVDTLEAGSLGVEFEGLIDRTLMARLYPNSLPPAPLNWDDMDGFGATAVRHIWLVADGRHFDADVPDGVDNLFDLPIMRRCLAARIEENRPDLLPVLITYVWWNESFAMCGELRAWRAGQHTSNPSRP